MVATSPSSKDSPGDGRGVEHLACPRCQVAELVADGSRDAGRRCQPCHLGIGDERRSKRPRALRAGYGALELLEIERVPAALAVQGCARGAVELRVQHSVRLVRAEWEQLEAAPESRSLGRIERGDQPARSLPEGKHREQGPAETAHEVPDHLNRRLVCPMHIVQRKDHRLFGGQALEHGADRVVGSVALTVRPRDGELAGEPRQRREDHRELCDRGVVERV